MLNYHQNQLQIIHYERILQISTCFIELQCMKQRIHIKGNTLSLILFNENEIIIQGEVHAIEFH